MKNALKIGGILVSLIGAASAIVADQINEQKMKETIREEVKREFAERENTKES